jgi:hypothetical protein
MINQHFGQPLRGQSLVFGPISQDNVATGLILTNGTLLAYEVNFIKAEIFANNHISFTKWIQTI